MSNKFESVDSLPVKYRPTKLSDVVGNKGPLSILKGSIKSKKVFKNILLSGSTGSGKTTIAKIMAMIYNCEELKGDDPCLKCSSCLSALKDKHPDIIELNAAGESGKIEGIRDILRLSKIQPRYNFKVFILDEAQGLTGKSKEEILKPLENPPPNTIWILCSMNPEKLDKAIHGRSQRIFLNYPLEKDIKKRLIIIIKKEYPDLLSVVKPFLKTIVDKSMCQPRDSIAVLDSVINSIIGIGKDKVNKKKINKIIDQVLDTESNIDAELIKFVRNILLNKKSKLLQIINSIELTKVDEFVSKIFRHSYYASLYYLTKNNSEEEGRLNKRSFWDVNFIKFNQTLDKIQSKIDIDNLFKLSSACTETTIKIRSGLITPEQAIMYLMKEYFNN